MKTQAKRETTGAAGLLSARERSESRRTARTNARGADIPAERLSRGIWEQALAQHPDGKGGIRESVTVRDLAAMAGGAGALYKRGSITREQFLAASWLRKKSELAEATGRSVSDVRERVDGGKSGDGSGLSLASAFAVLAREEALDTLEATERKAVFGVVFSELGLAQVADAVEAPEWSGVTRLKTRRARVLEQLVSGLDKIAVIAAWRNWG